jgi:hypothetical protein
MNNRTKFDPERFKRIIRTILLSGDIRIPMHIQMQLDAMGHDPKKNPYNGHCAQATVAAWVLGKELYGQQFNFKAFHSPDNWHYWLAKDVQGKPLKKDALDLTEHQTDGDFDYADRKPARWITRKKSRGDLAGMKRLKDAVKIYDLAKIQLLEDSQ